MKKTKGYAMGGAMKKTKGYAQGGKMKMVKDPDSGKMVPEFAADGKGKMAKGGMTKSTPMKKMAGGEMKPTRTMAKGGPTKSTARMNSGRQTALAKKSKDFIASIIGTDNEEALNKAAGKVLNAIPDLPGLAGEAEKKRKEAGMKSGGMTKKTKGYAKGGPMKKTKGYSKGGVARGMGAATKGGNFTRGG